MNEIISFPLVYIIVPAWKENEILKRTLSAIQNLTYPNLKVIINAGGNQETIEIANSFSKYKNFFILEQQEGRGKIKAINDCLKQVSEGIVCLIDADVQLTDELLLSMIYPIINEQECVTISSLKPHSSIKNKDLVIYTFINRNPLFRRYVSKYTNYTGPITAIKYEVIKKISRFPEGKFTDDGRVIGKEVLSHNYKIYYTYQFLGETFNFPFKLKSYIHQNLRWLENSYFRKTGEKNKTVFMKFLFMFFISFYLFCFIFLFFIDSFFLIIGFLLVLSFYLKRIRKIIFYKYTLSELVKFKFKKKFFIKILFYIYVDLLMNIIAFLEIVFFRKQYKKRKNIDNSID